MLTEDLGEARGFEVGLLLLAFGEGGFVLNIVIT